MGASTGKHTQPRPNSSRSYRLSKPKYTQHGLSVMPSASRVGERKRQTECCSGGNHEQILKNLKRLATNGGTFNTLPSVKVVSHSFALRQPFAARAPKRLNPQTGGLQQCSCKTILVSRSSLRTYNVLLCTFHRKSCNILCIFDVVSTKRILHRKRRRTFYHYRS